jgi:hypothetical protein
MNTMASVGGRCLYAACQLSASSCKQSKKTQPQDAAKHRYGKLDAEGQCMIEFRTLMKHETTRQICSKEIAAHKQSKPQTCPCNTMAAFTLLVGMGPVHV